MAQGGKEGGGEGELICWPADLCLVDTSRPLSTPPIPKPSSSSSPSFLSQPYPFLSHRPFSSSSRSRLSAASQPQSFNPKTYRHRTDYLAEHAADYIDALSKERERERKAKVEGRAAAAAAVGGTGGASPAVSTPSGGVASGSGIGVGGTANANVNVSMHGGPMTALTPRSLGSTTTAPPSPAAMIRTSILPGAGTGMVSGTAMIGTQKVGPTSTVVPASQPSAISDYPSPKDANEIAANRGDGSTSVVDGGGVSQRRGRPSDDDDDLWDDAGLGMGMDMDMDMGMDLDDVEGMYGDLTEHDFDYFDEKPDRPVLVNKSAARNKADATPATVRQKTSSDGLDDLFRSPSSEVPTPSLPNTTARPSGDVAGAPPPDQQQPAWTIGTPFSLAGPLATLDEDSPATAISPAKTLPASTPASIHVIEASAPATAPLIKPIHRFDISALISEHPAQSRFASRYAVAGFEPIVFSRPLEYCAEDLRRATEQLVVPMKSATNRETSLRREDSNLVPAQRRASLTAGPTNRKVAEPLYNPYLRRFRARGIKNSDSAAKGGPTWRRLDLVVSAEDGMASEDGEAEGESEGGGGGDGSASEDEPVRGDEREATSLARACVEFLAETRTGGEEVREGEVGGDRDLAEPLSMVDMAEVLENPDWRAIIAERCFVDSDHSQIRQSDILGFYNQLHGALPRSSKGLAGTDFVPSPSPRIRLVHQSVVLEVDSIALSVWDKMAFEPACGPKDTSAVMLVRDASDDLVDAAAAWLGNIGEAYQLYGLGKHSSASVGKNGVIDVAHALDDSVLSHLRTSSQSLVVYVLVDSTVPRASDVQAQLPKFLFSDSIAKRSPVTHLVPFTSIIATSSTFGAALAHSSRLFQDPYKRVAISIFNRLPSRAAKVAPRTSVRALLGQAEAKEKAFVSPMYTLASPVSNYKRRIDLKLKWPPPSLDVLNGHRMMHIAYSWTKSGDVFIAATDEQAGMLAYACERVDARGGTVMDLRKVVKVVWKFVERQAETASIEWNVVISRLDRMGKNELNAWTDSLQKLLPAIRWPVVVSLACAEDSPPFALAQDLLGPSKPDNESCLTGDDGEIRGYSPTHISYLRNVVPVSPQGPIALSTAIIMHVPHQSDLAFADRTAVLSRPSGSSAVSRLAIHFLFCGASSTSSFGPPAPSTSSSIAAKSTPNKASGASDPLLLSEIVENVATNYASLADVARERSGMERAGALPLHLAAVSMMEAYAAAQRRWQFQSPGKQKTGQMQVDSEEGIPASSAVAAAAAAKHH